MILTMASLKVVHTIIAHQAQIIEILQRYASLKPVPNCIFMALHPLF